MSHTSGHPTFWSWVVYYFSCSPAESTQPRGRGFAKPRRSRGFAGDAREKMIRSDQTCSYLIRSEIEPDQACSCMIRPEIRPDQT
ncbi:Protein of unknown function [Cotesia congregata]|uniref:Uncharacterized protein n=1 Tax=Cotesia congregata TaxID=51543 RepID=A0A8J2MX33_COTCN|nr:Protein of unknown function [Cotesia congregata]